MTGGELIARLLRAEGVEVVFGIIDGTYFGFYASLRDLGIRLITPRHETSAVHMAGAYARLTGKLGVCMASNGPGVANALPGVADRGGAYQYVDQVAVTKPMTKWSGAVRSHGRIPEIVRRALRISFRGRPGVVHVNVPEDLMNGKLAAAPPPILRPEQYRRVEPIAPSPDAVRRAAELLVAAELPMLHAGSGVLHAGASVELAAVAEALAAPITTSWAGRAVVAETSEHSIPMIYVNLNNRVRNRADAVLVLGSRLGETDWWGKPPYWRAASSQRTIQVDVDEEILGLNKPVDLAVLADAREFLNALLAELGRRAPLPGLERRRKWLGELAAAKRAARAGLDKKLAAPNRPVHSSRVAGVCQEVFGDGAILVVDGGNTAIWANFYHQVRVPGTVLSTFKFGMLGAGVSQALGAKVACPERRVCCILSDGAMGFHPQEIETAIRNELAVTYVVLCDKQWGMVKMNQQFALNPLKTLLKKSLSPEETINADLGEIRFDLLAESMGAHGERVSSVEELKPALERSLACGRAAVVHVDVDPVAHMWAPSLRHFKNMHAEPTG
jgi:acetolactate synthase-1/2/3 large subunit